MSTNMFGIEDTTASADPTADILPLHDVAAAPAAAAPVAVAAPVATPTLQQAVDKAVAKASADVVVATNPSAVHAVKLAPLAPTVLGSTATGAGIGFCVAGPPGAAIGAAAGWISERYQIGGGFFGKAIGKVKGTWHKYSTTAPAAK